MQLRLPPAACVSVSGLIFASLLFTSSRCFVWQGSSEVHSVAIPILPGSSPSSGLWHPVVTMLGVMLKDK